MQAGGRHRPVASIADVGPPARTGPAAASRARCAVRPGRHARIRPPVRPRNPPGRCARSHRTCRCDRAATPAGSGLILVLNIVIVVACFAGAVGLVVGKRVRESVKAAPQATVVGAEGVPVNADGVFVGDPTATFPAADPEAKNFLIVGDDSHACVDPGLAVGRRGRPANAATSASAATRSWSCASTRPRKRAAILSFPRDLWVKVPGHGRSRINSAYRKGDYTLLAQTLFDNFGVKVDHYVQVDFCAFKTIVDAVGGVKVPVRVPGQGRPRQPAHRRSRLPHVQRRRGAGLRALALLRVPGRRRQVEAGQRLRPRPRSPASRTSCAGCSRPRWPRACSTRRWPRG